MGDANPTLATLAATRIPRWRRSTWPTCVGDDESYVAVPNAVCASPTSPPASPTYSWGRQHHGGGESYVGDANPTLATLAATLATRIPWPTSVGDDESHVGDTNRIAVIMGAANLTWETRILHWRRWRRRWRRAYHVGDALHGQRALATTNPTLGTPIGLPSPRGMCVTNVAASVANVLVGSPTSWGRRILRGRRESYVGDAGGEVGDAHTTLGTLYMAWRRRILRWGHQ